MFDLLLYLTGMATGEFSLWALELALGEGKRGVGWGGGVGYGHHRSKLLLYFPKVVTGESLSTLPGSLSFHVMMVFE